jgi:hypothetical protein
MELNELSCIAYTRFVNENFESPFPDDDRLFNKALPSDTPIEPGSNKPMISRSPYAPSPESSVHTVLKKLSKQGFRVSNRFIDYVSEIFPRNSNKRKLWQDAIDRTFLGLWRNRDKVIYCDTFYDWRGRVYHMSGEWGSLQNNKMSRAALSTPEKYAVDINSEHYAYMIKVFKHEGWPTTYEEAYHYLMNPDYNGDGALDWMAVRAALTIGEIHDTGMTDYLLEQDATCSGFQHMGLIMRDMKLCKIVNAIFTEEVLVELYTHVAEAGKVAELLFDGSKTKARSFTKKIVMLTGYGSGAHGLASSYWNDYGGNGELNDDGRLIPDEDSTIYIGKMEFSFEALKQFVKARQDVLFDEFASLEILRNLCVRFFASCMQEDPSKFTWTTPDGFTALRIITEDEQEKNAVSAAGAMPNLIHSLDAAIVRQTILSWNGDLGVVHDAFFTGINDALELREHVKNAYADVHTNLENFPIQAKGKLPAIGRCIGV